MQRYLTKIPYYGVIALLVYMPLHVFLSQSLSLVTGGLEAWKIGKDILLALLTMFTICLVFWQGKGNKVFRWLVVGGTIYGVLHLLLWVLHPDIYDRSALIGTIYNMRLPCYLILGVGAALMNPDKFTFSSLFKVTIGISTLVATLGVLQHLLPKDILTHLGYGVARGARAAFYIDDNRNLPIRIMSTLREPNALGAYLILPATILGVSVLRVVDERKRYILGVAFALHVLAICLTLSRSALIGLMISLTLVAGWQYNAWLRLQVRRFWLVAAGLIIVIVCAGFGLRNTIFFQDYIIHGNKNEQVADLDSNDYHLFFIKEGMQGMAHEPLGHGPGTAGLASIQNPQGSFLTENYYIQIGYELGIVGLVLFAVVNIWVYLLIKRSTSAWKVVLLASFWAYMFTNMLLHTWGNEAVAAQWWLLAGMIIGPVIGTKTTEKL